MFVKGGRNSYHDGDPACGERELSATHQQSMNEAPIQGKWKGKIKMELPQAPTPPDGDRDGGEGEEDGR